ncbi:TetR family transcriptional regulator [Chelativorans sp. ZYF759]|uniref:TetR/AcrR family transcriptional regulator n=1 Tax=Chelativorans sp. ZYF759 TaxID=2692213 RepID=UPI00145C6AE5|nr:TetR/AcrR family transcriptional regulator [Chelativorans sp. ZYF759]NMG38189.1 TetR family transcriptional regulator [Chelativorans sp. ZYF759]
MISLLDHLENSSDPKRARILVGATKVFLAYGFQRTTMDDIARSAEISRPALYVVFRNKTDIYRALVSEFLEQMVAETRAVLARRDPLAQRFSEATCCFMDLLDEVETAPHGQELVDMQNSLAGDIVETGRVAILVLFREAVEAELRRSGRDLAAIGLTAAGMAEMLLDAIDGMKMRRPGREAQKALHAQYVRAISLLITGPGEAPPAPS